MNTDCEAVLDGYLPSLMTTIIFILVQLDLIIAMIVSLWRSYLWRAMSILYTSVRDFHFFMD